MDKKLAREYLIKSKLYRFMAMIFAGVGVVVLCVLYSQQEKTDGGFLDMLRDPITIIMMVFPFMPAIVLSFMAQRCEKKLQEALKEG